MFSENSERPLEADSDRSHRTQTILLVEDEELVRKMTRQILEMCGYEVIEACDGQDALRICGKSGGDFDLLLTDIVMPKMNGCELAKRLKERKPELRVLFYSGYADPSVVDYDLLDPDRNFIVKPFSPDDLSRKVREILDAPLKRLEAGG